MSNVFIPSNPFAIDTPDPKFVSTVLFKLLVRRPVAFFKFATVASFDIIVIVVLFIVTFGANKSSSTPVAFPESSKLALVKLIVPFPSEYAAYPSPEYFNSAPVRLILVPAPKAATPAAPFFTSILAAPKFTAAPPSAYTANPLVAGFDVSSTEIVKAFPEVDAIVPPLLYIAVAPFFTSIPTVPEILIVFTPTAGFKLYIPDDVVPSTFILLPFVRLKIPLL